LANFGYPPPQFRRDHGTAAGIWVRHLRFQQAQQARDVHRDAPRPASGSFAALIAICPAGVSVMLILLALITFVATLCARENKTPIFVRAEARTALHFPREMRYCDGGKS
jgi:hypothetical protein